MNLPPVKEVKHALMRFGAIKPLSGAPVIPTQVNERNKATRQAARVFVAIDMHWSALPAEVQQAIEEACA